MVMTTPDGTSFVASGRDIHIARWPLRQPTEAFCKTLLWIDSDLLLHPTTAIRHAEQVCKTCRLTLTKTNTQRRKTA